MQTGLPQSGIFPRNAMHISLYIWLIEKKPNTSLFSLLFTQHIGRILIMSRHILPTFWAIHLLELTIVLILLGLIFFNPIVHIVFLICSFTESFDTRESRPWSSSTILFDSFNRTTRREKFKRAFLLVKPDR